LHKPFATLVVFGCCALLAACVPPPDEIQLPIGGLGGAASIAPGTGGETSTGGSGTGGASTGGTTGAGGLTGIDGGVSADVPPQRDAGNADSGRGGTGAGGPNAGTGGTAATGAGGVAASVCTSRTTYSGGNGPTMRPGANCRSCHGFTVSGTIYPTAHEPTNCNGVNGSTGTRVVITGANGQTLTLTPSAAGNFYSNTQLGGSFMARVTTTAGGTRSMLQMQTSGDCNSCHTQNGANGAPGRIMAP
jgi:hypothetical protein